MNQPVVGREIGQIALRARKLHAVNLRVAQKRLKRVAAQLVFLRREQILIILKPVLRAVHEAVQILIRVLVPQKLPGQPFLRHVAHDRAQNAHDEAGASVGQEHRQTRADRQIAQDERAVHIREPLQLRAEHPCGNAQLHRQACSRRESPRKSTYTPARLRRRGRAAARRFRHTGAERCRDINPSATEAHARIRR